MQELKSELGYAHTIGHTYTACAPFDGFDDPVNRMILTHFQDYHTILFRSVLADDDSQVTASGSLARQLANVGLNDTILYENYQ